jgi:hypothetical protein
MPTLATKPSTRRLSEVARHVVIPSGIVTTGWPAVEAKCREFGDEFDEWQRGAGQLILGKRADGSYAATVGGVTLSIPRQVAKTFLVGRIVFVLCVLFPGLRVIWTAHRTRTATNTFKHLQGYAKRAKVAPHVADIRRTNGEQEIQFTNGSILMFGAREAGFGRGFDEVDIEVFDEAQILTAKALEDMVAATNQSRHEHGALLFFMGTPPRPVDPGEAFKIRRSEALTFKPDPDEGFGIPVVGDEQLYIECSADRAADPDDKKQWARANPSYPHRTPLRSMLRLRNNLPGEDSWRREALGIWDAAATRAQPMIDPDEWARLAIREAPPDGVVSYGVKFSPDGMTVALSAAIRPIAGPVHVEGIEHRSVIDGTRWLVDWLTARSHCVAIDGRAGAGALVSTLEKAGMPKSRIVRPSTDQVITAHAGFVDAVIERRLSHLDDEVLARSAASAGRRLIGTAGGWGFQSINEGDVTLIEAAVLAHWGAVEARGGRPSTGRRAVVL